MLASSSAESADADFDGEEVVEGDVEKCSEQQQTENASSCSSEGEMVGRNNDYPPGQFSSPNTNCNHLSGILDSVQASMNRQIPCACPDDTHSVPCGHSHHSRQVILNTVLFSVFTFHYVLWLSFADTQQTASHLSLQLLRFRK